MFTGILRVKEWEPAGETKTYRKAGLNECVGEVREYCWHMRNSSSLALLTSSWWEKLGPELRPLRRTPQSLWCSTECFYVLSRDLSKVRVIKNVLRRKLPCFRGSQLLQLNRGLSWEGSRRSSCSTPESVRSDFGVVACIPSPASLHLLLCPLSSPQGLFFPFQTDVQSHMLFPSLLPLSSASEK